MAGGIGPSDVLIVVDVQNDFCPGGRLAVPGGDEVVMPINRLAAGFAHVVLTQDWHPAGHHSFASSHPGRAPFEAVTAAYGPQVLWPDHCVQGSAGAVFHPALDVPHAALVLRKGFRREIDSYSAFYENDRTTQTGLAGYLRERGLARVFLAGLPSISACAGPPKTPAASASRRSSSRTPAGGSISTGRSPRRGRALRSAAWCAWGRGRWGRWGRGTSKSFRRLGGRRLADHAISS
jgi:nicotinamidase/pyrazinamidase